MLDTIVKELKDKSYSKGPSFPNTDFPHLAHRIYQKDGDKFHITYRKEGKQILYIYRIGFDHQYWDLDDYL